MFWISNTGAAQQRKPSSDIHLANLPSGGTLLAGKRVDFSVSMNREAVGLITRIVVTLRQESTIIAEATINNPQTSNPVSLQVPANTRAGAASLMATGSPTEATTGFVDTENVNIAKVNSSIILTKMPSGGTLLAGKRVDFSYYRKKRLDFRYATTFATMVTSFAG